MNNNFYNCQYNNGLLSCSIQSESTFTDSRLPNSQITYLKNNYKKMVKEMYKSSTLYHYVSCQVKDDSRIVTCTYFNKPTNPSFVQYINNWNVNSTWG